MTDLSRVVAERVAHCPFSVAHDYAEDFFKAAAAGGSAIHVPLRDVLPTLRGRLRQPVRIVFERRPDYADTGRTHDALDVHWTAGTRLFPDFHGSLRLGIVSVDETLLTLDGTYRPPFGPPGRLFDLILGRRIARATLRGLLSELVEAMERREAAFRATALREPQGDTGTSTGSE